MLAARSANRRKSSWWLGTVHCVCRCIQTLSNAVAAGTVLCIQNDRDLETVHAGGPSNSSGLAHLRNEVSENTCKVYQSKTRSPCLQNVNALFTSASRRAFLGPLKLTPRSFETHTAEKIKPSLAHLLPRNQPGPLLC